TLTTQHTLHFPVRHGRRRMIQTPTHEIADAGSLPEEIENSVVIFHFDHQIPRIKLAFANHAFAAAHLGDALHGYDDLTEIVLEAFNLPSPLDSLFNRLFASALYLHHVPPFIARTRGRGLVGLGGRRLRRGRRRSPASLVGLGI